MSADSEPLPPIHRRLLRFARIIFVVYTAAVLLLYVASLPGYFAHVSAGTVSSDIVFDIYQPTGTAYFTAQAATAGLPLNMWLIANTATTMLIIAISTAVAGIIFWRLPQSGFALLSAYVIILTSSAAMDDAIQTAGVGSALGPLLSLPYSLGALVWPIFPIWLYLFPDGRAIPRWVRWPIGILMGLFMVFMVIAILANAGLLPVNLLDQILALVQRADVVLLLALPAILLALGSQIYRYWRVSGAAERQQTKWFVLGLSLFALSFFLTDAWPFLARVEAINGSLSLIIFPLTIGIALLRYRLWDVDVIIRRTTSYAIVTALLALVYLGSVVVLQRLFTAATGQTSTAAVVLSTLLIAALFLPVRRRVQDAIDRRFFRKKYDAEKVLEQFAATARDETDLDVLAAELVRVIQETMQPAFVNLVLLEPGRVTAATGQAAQPGEERDAS